MMAPHGPLVTLLQALVVVAFVSVHLFAGQLRFLYGVPRSRWLSVAGGVSVAYVFMHVFPELESAERQITGSGLLPAIEHHAYLLALAGLVVFYGVERSVSAPRARRSAGAFWLHMGSFAAYNGLIGYLLVHRERQDLQGLIAFSIAMGLHFVVNDFGLREDHRADYERTGRWVLAAAIVAGWTAGLATTIGDAPVGSLFAFLAGGVMLNVLKEELPEERKSRFVPFALGAAGSAVLLLGLQAS